MKRAVGIWSARMRRTGHVGGAILFAAHAGGVTILQTVGPYAFSNKSSADW